MPPPPPETADLSPWAELPFTHGLPSPYYNPSHHHLRTALRTYINTHILPHQLTWETAGCAPRSEALRWAHSGFAFLDVPAQYRPPHIPLPAGIPLEDLDVFHMLIMTDETSRVEGGVMTALSGASIIGLPPIIHHGTAAQKAAWLPRLFTLETSFALAITEPTHGSDVANLLTAATLTPDRKHYLVNGTKKWITGTPSASHFTTAVRTGPPSSGAAGLSVLVIPKDSAGLTTQRIPNSGHNAGGASLLDFEDVLVSAENLLGKEGEGFKIIMKNFNRERFVMAVACNRKSRTCLSHALRYAHERETFGKPLIANQIITAKFATLARYIESHWAWLESLAYAVQSSPLQWQDPAIASACALAKVHGGRILELAVREAQQVLGGKGYQRGEGTGGVVEQISRDLRMFVVGGGSEEVLGELGVRMEVAGARARGWDDDKNAGRAKL